MAASMQSFADVIRATYEPMLREMQRDLNRTLFWDGTYGPPDPRPFLGPPEPPDTVCGDMGCRCCAKWREERDDHCC